MITVNKDTVVGDLLDIDPDTGKFLLEIGMHCLSCPMSRSETLEESCMVHGEDVGELVDRINKFLSEKAGS